MMLTKTIKAARVVSQAPLKVGACHLGCGAKIHYRTSPRIICEACKPAHRAEQMRAVAERQRRAKGIAQVKGTDIPCQRCGKEFTRSGIAAKFCAPCSAENIWERARKASRAKSRAKGAPEFGTLVACKHCKVAFLRGASRECYCPACKDLQKRGELPHLKAFRKSYAKLWRNTRKADPDWCDQEKTRQKQSRQRRKINPAFSINERMSAAIRASLKGGKNGASWEALVGYSASDLVRHLERQFLPGMSWDRRSEIHIDHIRPLASFEFSSPEDAAFRDAWSLSNLRPLWKTENLAKNASRLFLI